MNLIRPPCSTTNNRPEPSLGCWISSGLVKLLATGTSSTWSVGGGGEVFDIELPLHPEPASAPITNATSVRFASNGLRSELRARSAAKPWLLSILPPRLVRSILRYAHWGVESRRRTAVWQHSE